MMCDQIIIQELHLDFAPLGLIILPFGFAFLPFSWIRKFW